MRTTMMTTTYVLGEILPLIWDNQCYVRICAVLGSMISPWTIGTDDDGELTRSRRDTDPRDWNSRCHQHHPHRRRRHQCCPRYYCEDEGGLQRHHTKLKQSADVTISPQWLWKRYLSNSWNNIDRIRTITTTIRSALAALISVACVTIIGIICQTS